MKKANKAQLRLATYKLLNAGLGLGGLVIDLPGSKGPPKYVVVRAEVFDQIQNAATELAILLEWKGVDDGKL